ncbi:hypothetical protein [Alloactinosynnema sp. L-07]|uniref:hypothetical protein n=1 Tax=Alloactinosynnema sp. L-07 TaxID=1653480 RepID=UPI00065F01CD|nr:hypothetical protein [Alloactinosynnema sp. L-07]CRK57511.1 hypothetical protein [Alloactinosynnema sp. L-07]
MSVLEEMTKLMLDMPGPKAGTQEVADWYARKARLLEHIAAEGGPDAEQVRELALLAYRRSQSLHGRAA